MTSALSCGLVLTSISTPGVLAAQDTPNAFELVRQLGQFPAAIDARPQSDSGQPMPVEQQRAKIISALRDLGDQATPALLAALTDPDAQIRRNVVLLFAAYGAPYVKPAPINLLPFRDALVAALNDNDERVRALTAQAISHLGSEAAVAVPALVALLGERSEGLRNSACIGLAGIGPAARDALPALRRALSDPSNDVRRFAQRAVDRIDQNMTP